MPHRDDLSRQEFETMLGLLRGTGSPAPRGDTMSPQFQAQIDFQRQQAATEAMLRRMQLMMQMRQQEDAVAEKRADREERRRMHSETMQMQRDKDRFDPRTAAEAQNTARILASKFLENPAVQGGMFGPAEVSQFRELAALNPEAAAYVQKILRQEGVQRIQEANRAGRVRGLLNRADAWLGVGTAPGVDSQDDWIQGVGTLVNRYYNTRSSDSMDALRQIVGTQVGTAAPAPEPSVVAFPEDMDRPMMEKGLLPPPAQEPAAEQGTAKVPGLPAMSPEALLRQVHELINPLMQDTITPPQIKMGRYGTATPGPRKRSFEEAARIIRGEDMGTVSGIDMRVAPKSKVPKVQAPQDPLAQILQEPRTLPRVVANVPGANSRIPNGFPEFPAHGVPTFPPVGPMGEARAPISGVNLSEREVIMGGAPAAAPLGGGSLLEMMEKMRAFLSGMGMGGASPAPAPKPVPGVTSMERFSVRPARRQVPTLSPEELAPHRARMLASQQSIQGLPMAPEVPVTVMSYDEALRRALRGEPFPARVTVR